MKCPNCPRTDSKVIDSRFSKEGAIIRRRRECEGCGKRFTTYERVEAVLPVVVKKDGRREEFDRAKVLNGIRKACEKRPVSTETIDGVVNRVEKWAQVEGDEEIQSSKIGEYIMKELQKLDEVAYVRFASVYRSFKDIGEFMNELSELLAKDVRKK